MKKTKVCDSILTLAKLINRENNFKLMLISAPLPKVVKILIYELFVNKIDFKTCSIDEQQAYNNILDYCLELEKIGFVNLLD